MGKPPVLAALAALLAFTGTALVQEDPAAVVWSADANAFPPEHFLYLLFPREADVSILAEGEDRAIAPLGRATTGTVGELRHGPFVTAWHGRTRGRVAASDLAYLPRAGADDEEIGRWRETVSSWDAYGPPDVSFDRSAEGRETVVTLSTRYRSGREERFVYRTDGESAVPLAWTSHPPGSASLGTLRRLSVTALVAAIVFTVARWSSRSDGTIAT